MQKNQQLKGAALVFLGAASYGILATTVKYANNLGIHTSVLTLFQFLIGAIILILLSQQKSQRQKIGVSSKLKLMLFGTALGITSIFYYLAIQYIPVSMGIILLMQSIWMSVVLEGVLTRKFPSLVKIIGAIAVLTGTLLATNLLVETATIDWKGIALGMVAALSYTITIYASSNIESNVKSIIRSKYLVLGGLVIVLIFWNIELFKHAYTLNSLFWGLLLALFGTVIPPILFTRGIPLIGIGRGSIISAVEIPVSILSAHFILGEFVSIIQWIGVLIILLSIVVVNLSK